MCMTAMLMSSPLIGRALYSVGGADSLVPVCFGVSVQRGEHDGQDPRRVIAD